uniref:Caeridin-1.4 n=3 Tax=Opisthokonta TaxID=33154 RepID=CDN14_RANCH|nr:RecName: Full=Caeridin-1.4 [Ranoidea chloris]P62582.1 RecName: Full=Caeridin-1.4 [Litoria xanthomera]
GLLDGLLGGLGL